MLKISGAKRQGRNRRQVALTGTRVMLQHAALNAQASNPNRQLVRHNNRLRTLAAQLVGGTRRILNSRSHTANLIQIRLTPGGARRVVQLRPVTRVLQQLLRVHVQTLKVVIRLNDALIRLRGQTQQLLNRGGRLTGTLQRRADQMHETGSALSTSRELLSAQTHHLLALIGQTVAGQTAVHDTLGVVHLAVTHEVNFNGGSFSHNPSLSDSTPHPKQVTRTSPLRIQNPAYKTQHIKPRPRNCRNAKTPPLHAEGGAKEVYLLLVAALVAGLTKQLAVLLLGHTLAALLDNGTHRISSLYSYPAEPFDSVATRGNLYRYNRSKTHFRHRNTLAF